MSCLSSSGGLVQCPKGLVVQAHHSFADAPPLEVLLYPGGRGTRAQLVDDLQLDWVRRQREAVPLMTSVCTGSLIYAAAGLLAGRPATTYWGSLDRLAELDPTWRCTWSPGWATSSEPKRFAAASSTTPPTPV